MPDTGPVVPDDADDSDDDDEPSITSAAAERHRTGDQLSEQHELLAFIAGYVAHRCRDIDRSLGEPTSTARPGPSVPAAWVQLLSRGGLLVPSEKWYETVLAFEVIFCTMMGPTVTRQRGVTASLIDAILKKDESIKRKVARVLVRTRIWIRLRWLNRGLGEESARRRAKQQVVQHVASGSGGR